MAKKLILLMLCIPIIVMLGLFTTSKTVSLAIDVAVNGIEIDSDKFVYLDLDDTTKKEKISYTIYPINANNKDVSFDVTAYEDASPKAELSIDDEGYITALSTGKSKVTVTTNDGGYNASIVVEVVASGLVGIKASPEKSELYVGEETNINVSFNPTTANDMVLTYTSSNPNIAQIVGTRIKAISNGTSLITVASQAHPEIKSEFQITVKNRDILNIAYDEIIVSNRSGSFIVSVSGIDLSEPKYTIEAKAYNLDNTEALNILLTPYINDDLNIVVDFTNLANDFAKYNIVVEVYEDGLLISNSVTCNVSFSNDFNISTDIDFLEIKVGQRKEIPIYVDILDSSNISFALSVSNTKAIEVSRQAGNRISVLALKTASVTLTINASLGDVKKTLTINILVLPRTLNFASEVADLDLGDTLTFAGDISHIIEINSADEINSSLLDYLQVKVSNNNIKCELKLIENKLVLFVDKFSNVSEIVTFSIYYVDASSKEVELAKTAIKLIGDAVTVSNYNELMDATKAQKIVVLDNDIKDFPSCSEISDLDSVSTKIKSTYDTTYYKNLANEDNAYIRVLVEFKNDIYGNGYEINANNLINGTDATGQNINGIFARSGGPLHFVSASESNSSMASVKGQDNIVFAIYDNVSINNVTLKAQDDVLDLTELNYAGTTVEVLGDNVSIYQSRIMNGRTVLRVFGDATNNMKEINVSNCYLANAREFIIRTGSNRFVDGSTDNPSPYIDGVSLNLNQNKTDYLAGKVNQSEYDSKYITTYLTLSNVALEKSGIFSIALDSHFAGPLLADAKASGLFGQLIALLNGWKDLAKTSYGVKLTLDNTVRIYDWKKLESVDSSTLIEVNEKFEYAEALKFDVKALVESLAKQDAYRSIVTTYNDIQYVHGGIAFFGGGKNYDVVSYTDAYKNSLNFDLNNYQISLNDTDAAVLSAAAGNEPFYFLLCDANTRNFTPQIQEDLIASGEAYKFLNT